MLNSIIKDIKVKLSDSLSVEQLEELDRVLTQTLYPYDLVKKSTDIVVYDDTNEKVLKKFIAVKKLDGLQDSSLLQYYNENRLFLEFIGKNVKDITVDDIRLYLAHKRVSKATLNNKIRYLNAFYKWLDEEEVIVKNPMTKIHSVKQDKVIRPTLSQDDIATLEDNATNIRDIAMIEILYSTGVRVSELVNIKLSDIKNNECVVFGKGCKERVVYFNERSMHYLRLYLRTRTDNIDKLFVSLKKPYRALQSKGVECRLRKLGTICNIAKVHPHKFRRTVATDVLNRGMPLQEVQKMLGHEKVDTTMIYCNVSQNNVKFSHFKFA